MKYTNNYLEGLNIKYNFDFKLFSFDKVNIFTNSRIASNFLKNKESIRKWKTLLIKVHQSIIEKADESHKNTYESILNNLSVQLGLSKDNGYKALDDFGKTVFEKSDKVGTILPTS